MEHLAAYLIELALQDLPCLRYLPSAIAAAAVCLASICRSADDHWSPLLARQTGYSGADLKPCVDELLALFRRAGAPRTARLHASCQPTTYPRAPNCCNYIPTGAQLTGGGNLRSIHDKYSDSKCMAVAETTPPDVLPPL